MANLPFLGYRDLGRGKSEKRFLHGNPSGSYAEVKITSAFFCPGLDLTGHP